LAHGTDIGGSIRYPAYACGVHGLRPTLGRVAAFNASGPERGIGPQLMAVSGPIGRTIADLRLGLMAMAAPDARDPWWVPAPLEGPPVRRHASLCLRPGGMATVPAVEAALLDAGRRLEAAGWTVERIDDTPSFQEATDLQVRLWLGDGFDAMLDSAEREGDPGALAILGAMREMAAALPPNVVAQTLVRRATLTREWLAFLERHPVLVLPVSAELPFPDGLDLQGDVALQRVLAAQLVQTGLPLMGLPGLTVSTGMAGTAPVGVQVIAGRYREDLCLLAGAAIEAGGTPPSPVDPV
jgi:amidase